MPPAGIGESVPLVVVLGVYVVVACEVPRKVRSSLWPDAHVVGVAVHDVATDVGELPAGASATWKPTLLPDVTVAETLPVAPAVD